MTSLWNLNWQNELYRINILLWNSVFWKRWFSLVLGKKLSSLIFIFTSWADFFRQQKNLTVDITLVPMTDVINYSKLDGLKHFQKKKKNIDVLSFPLLKATRPKVKMFQECAYSRSFREPVSCFFHLLEAVSIPHLVAASPQPSRSPYSFVFRWLVWIRGSLAVSWGHAIAFIGLWII